MMLSLVICDDSPAVVERLRQMVGVAMAHTMPYQIDTFFSSRDLAQAVEQGLRPDIALLDIKIDEKDGIQLAMELFPLGSHTQVIFITGHIEYCTAVYETEHIYFLLKPVRPANLQKALGKAIEHLTALPPVKQLTLRSRATVQQIPISAIRYLESNARKVLISCGDTCYEHYTTIAALMNDLPETFSHCHKSFCVNMDHVLRMETDRFILLDGKTIPISQAKRAETRKRFLEFLNRSL